jgi:hypothetical protein
MRKPWLLHWIPRLLLQWRRGLMRKPWLLHWIPRLLRKPGLLGLKAAPLGPGDSLPWVQEAAQDDGPRGRHV